ncbi:MAG: hypothetical protein FJ109_18405, partial [Deltaproteobacteria bacterium]|nr:hypothetical protein [Deltaproteobacteria bacterium]
MHQDRSDRSRVGLGPGWPVVVAALALAVAQQACSNGGGGDPPKPDVDVGRSDAGFSDADQVDENRGKSDTAPDGDSMQRGSTIGPEGGQIPLPGGGLLSVPPGALAEPVEIVISEVAAPAPESFQAVGPFHSFAPSGLVFAVPATLTVPFDLEGLQAVPEDVSVVWSTDGGTYEPLPSDVDAADSSVSAEVSHFSDGGPAVFPEAMAVCCVDGVAGAFAGFLSLEDCTAQGP